MSTTVKRWRRGHTRISSKHQVTIPVDVMRRAGLRPGDELRAAVDEDGAVVLRRVAGPTGDVVARTAGRLTGMYGDGYLDDLRDEWVR